LATKKKKKATVHEKPLFKTIITLAWIAAILGVLFTIIVFLYISFSKLPDTDELENPSYEYATLIIADDGQSEIGRYFRKNREWTSYSELNSHLVDALVATEDERFFKHSGIDGRSTMRAIAKLGRRGGGSTITQQLSKLFFTNKSRNVIKRIYQKLQEWVIAVNFEKRYTKEEIIAMFLNKMEFNNDAVGIGSAAKTYFGKDQKNLNIEEAAVLIGMLKSPTVFNPISKPESALKRREVVLSQMKRVGKLTQSEYDSIRVMPMVMDKFNRSDHVKGPAPYFRSELTKRLRRILKEPQYADPSGKPYDLYGDGLNIYVTIDYDMQKHAENAMTTHMEKVQNDYFRVWQNKDPWSYEADARQESYRKNKLREMIDNSARYKKLRSKYLKGVISRISSDIEKVQLRNVDIKRLKKAKEQAGYLNQLLRDDFISKQQKSTYQQILDSDHILELINQWNKLERQANSAFSKKKNMKVFAHNAAGEKSITMSPLDSIKYHAEHLHLGSISIEPKSGYIKTWVGGIGFKYFQYDHIFSDRQIGSTFKPLIYMQAMQQWALSPCLKVIDQQYCIEKNDPNFDIDKTWCPENSNKIYSGEKLSLYEALKQSKNSISAYLMKEIGNVERVRDLAEQLGISKKKIPPYPSIALGVPDLSVYDMTGAYSTLVNKGVYVEPTFIKRIEDQEGKVIYQSNPKRREALDEQYAYLLVDMLRNAQSRRPWEVKSAFGGKTGTTDDHRDGWFMGITPELVVGTWVGGENQWIRFLDIREGQGGAMARPFFFEFIRNLENDPKIGFNTNAIFEPPSDGMSIEMDCQVYDALYQKESPVKDDEIEDEFEEEF